MQTSIYFWFGYPVPPSERMEMIADAGFDQVLLWWGDDYPESNGPKESLPDLARRNGLGVENIHVPFEGANRLWADPTEAELQLARYLRCVDDCADHGIPAMVLHLTNGDSARAPDGSGLDRMRRLAERAERRGVTVALENLRKPVHLETVFDAVRSDRIRFCYDSGHENCFTRTWDLLDRFGDRLAALHLHDNNGLRDQHLQPGEGTVHWPWLMDRIGRTGYPGPVSLELSVETSETWRNATAEEFLAAAHRKALELAALMESRRSGGEQVEGEGGNR